MDREKIVNAFVLCRVNEGCSTNCPYWNGNASAKECTKKLAEDVYSLLKEQPEIVRCKDCKHRPKEPNFKTYENGFDIEFPEGSKCPCKCSGDEYYSWYPEDDWFCASGERKEGGEMDD